MQYARRLLVLPPNTRTGIAPNTPHCVRASAHDVALGTGIRTVATFRSTELIYASVLRAHHKSKAVSGWYMHIDTRTGLPAS